MFSIWLIIYHLLSLNYWCLLSNKHCSIIAIIQYFFTTWSIYSHCFIKLLARNWFRWILQILFLWNIKWNRVMWNMALNIKVLLFSFNLHIGLLATLCLLWIQESVFNLFLNLYSLFLLYKSVLIMWWKWFLRNLTIFLALILNMNAWTNHSCYLSLVHDWFW